MPRRLIKKIVPHPDSLQKQWFFRMFGTRLADMHLWSTGRRAITAGFGAGLAICFVPLPIHLPLCLLCALIWRINLPVTVAAVFLVNPLTMVPVYYAAYRIGAFALQLETAGFEFQLSWDWVQNGLGPLWRPFLLGCLICSLVFGYGGYLLSEMLWRQVTLRRRLRRRRC
ncbi:MAG: hypothetical protein RLZZ200_298 [Pseudomonadota bacterium]|jgi:uncharacterized protein (DUF2062 family)